MFFFEIYTLQNGVKSMYIYHAPINPMKLCGTVQFTLSTEREMVGNRTNEIWKPKTRRKQGVWNKREIQLTRPALPYDYTCFARRRYRTSFE